MERGRRLEVIPLVDVTHITAEGQYARLHVRGREHLVRVRMKDLAARLDPALFWRIHRSTIVNLHAVEALAPTGSGDYSVWLRSGEKLRLSRTYGEELATRLGLL